MKAWVFAAVGLLVSAGHGQVAVTDSWNKNKTMYELNNAPVKTEISDLLFLQAAETFSRCLFPPTSILVGEKQAWWPL